MYSVYGDTVLDPFWGTGTTSLAAMIAGRNSVGYEPNSEFTTVFDEKISDVKSIAHDVVSKRIDRHVEFVKERLSDGKDFKYERKTTTSP